MARYRKKPVVIEAFQYFAGTPGDAIYAVWPQWAKDRLLHNVDGMVVGRAKLDGPPRIEAFPDHLLIHTLEGVMRADSKDWIIRGVQAEIYPCKPDIFAATYEATA